MKPSRFYSKQKVKYPDKSQIIIPNIDKRHTMIFNKKFLLLDSLILLDFFDDVKLSIKMNKNYI